MSYRLAVLVHLSGVILFFGNLVLAFSMVLSMRSVRDRKILAHGYGLLHRVDVWLSPISVALVFVGGVAAAKLAGIGLLQPWVTRPLLAFGISGIAFVSAVLPVQRELAALGVPATSAVDEDNHDGLRRRWLIAAGVSTMAATAAAVLMLLTSPR
jgi:uncharacterized membrane protein